MARKKTTKPPFDPDGTIPGKPDDVFDRISAELDAARGDEGDQVDDERDDQVDDERDDQVDDEPQPEPGAEQIRWRKALKARKDKIRAAAKKAAS